MNFRSVTKNILYRCAYGAGITAVSARIFKEIYGLPVKILFSHRIIDTTNPSFDILRELGNLTVDDFEKRIKYIHKRYSIISIDEFADYMRTGKKPRSLALVLTFDDGYRSMYTNVFPLLKTYNIPATFFLTTGSIEDKTVLWHDRLMHIIAKSPVRSFEFPVGSGGKYSLNTLQERANTYNRIKPGLKYLSEAERTNQTNLLSAFLQVPLDDIGDAYRMMTWQQIMEMSASSLVTFGGHTVTHPILTRVGSQQAQNEIMDSKKKIESELGGVELKYFAYPNGKPEDINEQIKNQLKDAGYSLAFTTSQFTADTYDSFEIPRYGLESKPFFMFGLRMSGFFDVLNRANEQVEKLETIKRKISIDRGLRHWLPQHLMGKMKTKVKYDDNAPVHIMICVADHFEPFHGADNVMEAAEKIKIWSEKYPMIADRYSDSDGVKPQHTWFYPPHHDSCFLKDIVELCKRGYGDVEMHLHHNQMDPFPDTAETLRTKIMKCVEDYSKYGIFCLPDGTKKFAFVHGDWSLNNSRGPEYCGINNETDILGSCGCFADFTFPSLGAAQPSVLNKMYYIKNGLNRAKSYNHGREVKVGGKSEDEFLMVQGVIGLRKKFKKYRVAIEYSNIDEKDKLSAERMDFLIKNAVRIKGMTNWLFIKLHTHGAKNSDFDSVIGYSTELMCDYMEKNFKNVKNYHYHYVTAREMYNIIKAAEAGMLGNPNQYRDFEIPKYVYK